MRDQIAGLITISTTLAMHVQRSIFSSLSIGTTTFLGDISKSTPCTFKQKHLHVASFHIMTRLKVRCLALGICDFVVVTQWHRRVYVAQSSFRGVRDFPLVCIARSLNMGSDGGLPGLCCSIRKMAASTKGRVVWQEEEQLVRDHLDSLGLIHGIVPNGMVPTGRLASG